jgi:hypothetical protein
MVSILLNNDMIKNYNIYGDENKDIWMFFFTTNEAHNILAKVRKEFI